MPYISRDLRHKLDIIVSDVDNPGALNFILTTIVHRYIERYGVNYVMLNEVIGVLECAKLELYRQVVAKYEDKKRIANGSVSGLDAKTLEDIR
jgi:hypothetical protein